MEDLFLNDCWVLHFHDPDNSEWTQQSYHPLHTISSVGDWIQAHTAFENLWQKGMFFLMREHIRPMWEDDHNKNGGCISFKVNKPDAGLYWYHLGCKVLGETLCKRKELWQNICGISISPKRNYCILRIWLTSKEKQHTSVELFHLEAPHYSQVIFKPHVDQKDYSESMPLSMGATANLISPKLATE